MAALDRRVSQLVEAGTPEALTSAVALLRKSEDVGCATPETAAPENFLQVAEGSLEAHAQVGGEAMLKQARECVEHFMRSRPAKSQFLSRAYFALGRVQASEAAQIQAKGQELAKALLDAANVVQEGIAIAATLGPTHRFLVYNGSVHVYRITRPLLTYEGDTAEKLATLLETTLKVLKEADEPDADWRLQLSMQLARCYERCGKKKEAAALLLACATGDKGEQSLADRCDVALQELLLQQQAHVLLDDAGALKKLRDEAAAGPTATPRRRALILTQLLVDGGPPGANDPKGGGFDLPVEVEGAIAALDPALGNALETEGGEAARRKAVLQVPSGGTPHDDVLVALATQAAAHGLLEIADLCATRCASSGKLACRVRSSYIKAMVMVGQLDASKEFPAQGDVYTRRMVSTRIEALHLLEEAVNSARRVGEPGLIQDGCVIIWNVSLPLLQPSLIGYAERVLYLAASALEAIASPLAQLRASLHLELARLDAARDFMQKAAQHVSKALILDVPADAGIGAEVNPVLRPLRTLGTRLALKTDVYRVAENPEEKVVLLLEQARTDRRIPLKKQILQQTLEELQMSEPDPEPKRTADEEAAFAAEEAARKAELHPDDQAKEEAEEKKKLEKRRERAALWSELMRAGWALRLTAMARASAQAVLMPTWNIGTDAELARDQADARYTLGETYISELQQKAEAAAEAEAKAKEALASGMTSMRNMPQIAPPGQAEAEAAARDALRKQALDNMCAGVAIGLDIKDDLIVQNGCIYVLNYNRSLLRAGDYTPLLSSLKVCVEALQKCDQEAMKRDIQQLRIVAATATALALGLEQIASTPPPPGSVSVPRTHDPKEPEQAAALKEAVDACKWACELCTGHPSVKRQLTACWARLQAYAGTKEPSVGTEPEAGALALLELLACGLVDTGAVGAGALGKAKELLVSEGTPRAEPELWVRVAQQAMALGDLASVVKACDAALRPLHARTDGTAAAPAAAPAGKASTAPEDKKGTLSTILREEWRWYAMAETVHSEAIGKLLKEGQQAALQQQLHANALIHLASAMTYANNAAEGSLLLSAAQRFWVHVKPFLSASPPDHRLRGPVGTALSELERLDASLQPQVTALRVRLYEAQLAVLAHAQAWAEGLKLLNAAFSSLPEASMRPLWEQKVAFMCQGGGKGLAGEMYKLKDFEPQVQARVWAVLGQSAPTTGEQLNAMLKAVDTLTAEPLLKVQYLIALAQWLYTHDFPPRDSEDQLMAAVDILMDHEDLPDDDEEDDIGDGLSSVGSTTISQSTKMTKSAVGSATGSKGARSSVGGSTRAMPEATLSVTQYEQLARIYLMRSMMASSLAARLECAFVATHYLTRLWNVSVSTCNAAELAKPGADPNAPPPFRLPQEVDEWAGWSPSAELEEAMAAIDSERVISPASLPDAQLTVAYLKYLIDLLLSAGLHLHALMPITLLRLVAKRILNSPALERAMALRLAHTLHQLGLTEKAAGERAALGELRPSPEAMRKNAVTLRQLRNVDDAVTTSMPTADDPPSDEALGMLAAPKARRKSCARPVEAEWVELAALLMEEGEWVAAREWLLEAEPLLGARGELEHESRCRRLLAKLMSLHGDPKAAVTAQLAAMGMTALEADPWADAVLDLAQYRADAGDDRLRIATLEAGVELAAQSAAEHASGAVDARAAQARLLQALGVAYGEAAAALTASGSGATDEAAAAARALDASVQITLELGDQRMAARALLDRAALQSMTPPSSADPNDDYVLEAEASHLDKLGELLNTAHACAERGLFLAAPRTLSMKLSLPIARELASIKVALAALHLRHASLNAKVAAANPTPGPSFPTVEGGDDTVILNFVAPTTVIPPPVHMEPEGRAQLTAASAVALAGGGAARARALVVSGEVLYARAYAAGWGKSPGRWDPPPVPEAAPEGEGEEGAPGAAEGVLAAVLGDEGEGTQQAEPGEGQQQVSQAGVAEARAAEAVLKEALSIALMENDLATAEQAAILLARACGIVQSDECAKYLSLYQACSAHRHWRAEWIAACEPSERLALLARLTQWLPMRWNAPGALPSLQAADAALSDETTGCASWRALSVPADPLEEMWPVLPGNMRVLTLAMDDSDLYATVVAAVPGELPPGGLPKGAEPPAPERMQRVSRAEGVAPAVLRLISEMASVLSAQSKAAIQRSKDDLFAVEQKDSAAAHAAAAAREAAREAMASGKVPSTVISSAIVPASACPEAESKLCALVDSMDSVILPLLEPLLPLLGEDEALGGGDKLQVVIVTGAKLAVLPLELLRPLRRAHIAAVTRDLSAPILGRRLVRTATEPCVGKKAAFGAAVDPRSEANLPKTAEERPDSAAAKGAAGKKGKAAPKKGKGEPTEAELEAMKKTKSLCAAFRKDVLEGTSVAFGKEWGEKAVLMGSHHVPSTTEWQRTMLGSSAFVYAGPGAFHEQLAPSRVAPLKLETVTACLLFDRTASDAASRRLAKEANAKGPRRIALESSHAAAALLSLSGVRTVLTNQWAAGAQSNHDMLVAILSKLGSGSSLGDALASSARDAMVYTPPPEVSEAASEDVTDPPAVADEVADDADAAPVQVDEAKPLWTILANPVVYGLPGFTVG